MKKAFSKKNFSISEPYGRFGNNVQQVGLAVMFTNKYKKNFYLRGFKYIDNFKIINSKFSYLFKLFKKTYRFFYFGSFDSEKHTPDYPIKIEDYNYYTSNFHKNINIYVKPQINFLQELNIDPKLLVIHIRGFSKENMNGNHPDYLQNPLIFYEKILRKYEKALIVTDNVETVVIKELVKKFDIKIQSTSLENDFNTISSASNLVTSGVGTFPIAAAMISNKIQNLFFTNLFLDRHLNPKMIGNNVNKFEFKIKNYLSFGEWNKEYKEIEKRVIYHSDIQIPDSFNNL